MKNIKLFIDDNGGDDDGDSMYHSAPKNPEAAW